MGKRTSLFYNRKSGGKFAIEDMSRSTGNRYFVDSGKTIDGRDLAGYGSTPDVPFLTTDWAIGQCTPNNGDIIYLMPGHAETLTSAGAITCNVEGITIQGLGVGADRPTLTFSSTDNSASVLITAASTKIKNIIGICDDDGLTNPFHVQAADCVLDIEWQDASATVEAAAAIVTTADADRINIKLKYIGFTAGDACINAILLDGISQGRINIDFYGIASTGVIEFNDTAVVDVNITGYMYNSGTTDFSKSVVDTATGSTWFATFYDGAAGSLVSGGSGDALVAGDLSDIQAKIDVIDAYHDVPTKDATTDAVMSDVIGKKDEDALYAVATNKTVIAYIKGLLEMSVVREATGDTDIDDSEVDYTSYQTLLTVTAPATGLSACTIDLDFNKASTGWDNVFTSGDILDILVVKQTDGTNYRATQQASAQITANGNGTLDYTESGWTYQVGPMQADCSVRILIKVSIERADCEIPYRVTSVGAAPTIVAVAAGA